MPHEKLTNVNENLLFLPLKGIMKLRSTGLPVASPPGHPAAGSNGEH